LDDLLEENAVLDHWTLKLKIIKHPLLYIAQIIKTIGCRPNQITLTGFLIGLGTLPALIFQNYWLALVCILVNRIFDGLDGALARITEVSDGGAYLDIVLDFIFYSLVVFGFALADPEANSLAACALLFSFIGTGSSFLAFAILAERRGIHSIIYPHKGIYYLGGLTEGTETILCFVLFCLFPGYFPILAFCFAGLCFLTTFSRVFSGFQTLR